MKSKTLSVIVASIIILMFAMVTPTKQATAVTACTDDYTLFTVAETINIVGDQSIAEADLNGDGYLCVKRLQNADGSVSILVRDNSAPQPVGTCPDNFALADAINYDEAARVNKNGDFYVCVKATAGMCDEYVCRPSRTIVIDNNVPL